MNDYSTYSEQYNMNNVLRYNKIFQIKQVFNTRDRLSSSESTAVS